MVDAMQSPVAAKPRAVIVPVRVPTMEDFLRHKLAEFIGKASPDEARQDREAEFLTLQQGDMTMQEYVNKFEHLARY